MSMGWDLPPGTPGPHLEMVEVRCVNPECPEYGHSAELEGVWELGSVSLTNEDELRCPTCMWERTDDWYDYFPIVDDEKGDPALVSIRDDVAITGMPASALRAIKPVLKQEYEERRRQLNLERREVKT